MKKRKNHILFSWILLFCFAAGQYMVYAHQHSYVNKPGKNYTGTKDAPRQAIKEKCSLCDVMHHYTMLTPLQVDFNPEKVGGYVDTAFNYGFNSVIPILAAGRAPPISNAVS